MKDQEMFFEPPINESPMLPLSVIVDSNGYATPPWTAESTVMDSAWTEYGVGQEMYDDNDFLERLMFPADYFSASLLKVSRSLLEPLPDVRSTYLPPTIPQLPTPPAEPEPVVDCAQPSLGSVRILSVSTAFNVETFTGLPVPDLVLVSSDETLFYIHDVMLSGTGFHTALAGLRSGSSGSTSISFYPCPFDESAQLWVRVKDITADELNIVLHVLYNTSCANHHPTFDTIERAIDKMASIFGLVVNNVIVPSNEFYNYLLTIVPMYPLRIYILAAHHKIHSLAVRASSHLLSFPIAAISDEGCERMGVIYLRKLLLLQMDRKECLIGILFAPPPLHTDTPRCRLHNTKILDSLWAGALVNLTYDLRADISSTILQRAFEPLKTQISCAQCVNTLQIKIKEVVNTWVSIKYTI